MDRAKRGSTGRGRPGKRALARLATSLVGYASQAPRAPRSKTGASVGLQPGPDQPGPTSTQNSACAPVQTRAHGRDAGTRAKVTGSGAHADGTNQLHVQPLTAQVGREASSAHVGSNPRDNSSAIAVEEPLAVASSVNVLEGSTESLPNMGQLVQLRAMLKAYRVAFEATGLALPTLPSGSATKFSVVGRAKGRGLMTAQAKLMGKDAPTRGAGNLTSKAAENPQELAIANAPGAVRLKPEASGTPWSGSAGSQEPGSKDGGGSGPGGLST